MHIAELACKVEYVPVEPELYQSVHYSFEIILSRRVYHNLRDEFPMKMLFGLHNLLTEVLNNFRVIKKLGITREGRISEPIYSHQKDITEGANIYRTTFGTYAPLHAISFSCVMMCLYLCI